MAKPRLKDPSEATFNMTYGLYKANAKKTGKEFSLTKSQFRILVESICRYCHIGRSNTATTQAGSIYVYNGIDRVDPAKGYEISNCVPACKHCNFAKQNMTQHEFATWLRRAFYVLDSGAYESIDR